MRRFYSSLTSKPKVLLTGASGQLGVGMKNILQKQLGNEQVICSDIRPLQKITAQDQFIYLDVLDQKKMKEIIQQHQINTIIHFSALLSYIGEKNPFKALEINMKGFENILKVSLEHQCRLYCPSTIGVFGEDSPKENVPDIVLTRPSTIYGITKVHAELLGQYFCDRFGLDFRSARYPGIISADTEPGGGTTDYAVEIFHACLKMPTIVSGSKIKTIYHCPLPPDVKLPMMYIDDCLEGTLQFLLTPESKFPKNSSRIFNLQAVSFTPLELSQSIQQFLQHHDLLFFGEKRFEIDFQIDFSKTDPIRTRIASTWPFSLNDQRAKEIWSWQPKIVTVDALVETMMNKIASMKGWKFIKKK